MGDILRVRFSAAVGLGDHDAVPAAAFELDYDSRTLCTNGRRVRLQEQPFVILRMLLERRGRVVTRDELREALWPAGTFVDFEHSLNAAMKRLRAALEDDADNPRFIETIPRRGYRFIADLEERADSESPRTRLAVLPFVELDADPDQDYFSRGFTEEMISELGRRSRGRLGVISAHSSMAFRNTALSARAIGAALRADYLLEGTIRRSGGHVRVTARLVESSSETQLWVETHQEPLADWLATQTAIAGHIAQSLAMELLPDAPPPGRISTDTTAYHAYLKGRYHWQRVADTGAGEARRFFEEAVSRDPGFALAHAGLALVYTLRAWYYHDVPRRALEQARVFASRAIQLDATVAEGHVADGDVKRLLSWDAGAARTAYATAIALNPSLETAHGAMARLLASAGRIAPAIREVELARELDLRCLTANTVAAWARYVGEDYDTAIALCRHTLEMDDTHLWAKLLLGSALLAAGSRREALRVLEDAAGAASPNPVAIATLAHAHAVTGNAARAGDLIAAAERMATTRYVSSYYLTLAHAGLRDTDAAFAALDRACEERDPAVLNIAVDPRVAVLRSDPRYARLLSRLRLDVVSPEPVQRARDGWRPGSTPVAPAW